MMEKCFTWSVMLCLSKNEKGCRPMIIMSDMHSISWYCCSNITMTDIPEVFEFVHLKWLECSDCARFGCDKVGLSILIPFFPLIKSQEHLQLVLFSDVLVRRRDVSCFPFWNADGLIHVALGELYPLVRYSVAFGWPRVYVSIRILFCDYQNSIYKCVDHGG